VQEGNRLPKQNADTNGIIVIDESITISPTAVLTKWKATCRVVT
jgi:hypothetical protein